MHDPVKEPVHYMGDGEVPCMRALKSMLHEAENNFSAMTIYWWGCAFKYLWRWPWKNGRQDVEKAMRCLEYLLDAIEGDEVED